MSLALRAVMLASTSPVSTAPPSTQAIAGRAGHAFTPQAMMQGFACHARGVELAASAPARVHARVRSKRVHDVHLRAEDGRLIIACTCPARSLGLDFCEHAWAALLEVDRANALSDLRATRGALVVVAAPPAPEPNAPHEAATTKEAATKKRAKAPRVAEPKEEPAKKRGVRRTSPQSPRATAAPQAPRGSRPRRPR